MLNYEDRLRLSWTEEPTQSPERAAELESTNLAVLQSVAALETGVSTRLRDEQPELYHELERLNARLDLLLDLVGRLASPASQQLNARPAVIAVENLRFRLEPGEPRPAGNGVLCLSLHAAVPQPLSLAGRITRLVEDAAGASWAEFRPAPMSETLREAFDQHVFRHHRRMIAERRAQAGA